MSLQAAFDGPVDAAVEAFAVAHHAVTADAVPALRELFGLARLPLGNSEAALTVRGRDVSTQVVNALRRTLSDEMPGLALTVPPDGFDGALSTDEFMLPQFVVQRIRLVPIRQGLPHGEWKGLRLALDVTNTTTDVLPVYTGDLTLTAGALSAPLFNPTFELAALQPGRRLVVRDIQVAQGFGGAHVSFQVARRTAFAHLDLEQWGDEDVRGPKGDARDLSGYRASCLVADPRHHRLTAVLPATTANPAEARAAFLAACANLRERLRLVETAVARLPAGAALDVGGGLRELAVDLPNETHTVGALLCRVVLDALPDVELVAYRTVPHEARIAVTLRCRGDPAAVAGAAARRAAAVFAAIAEGIASGGSGSGRGAKK